ncbi:MAG: phage baseplate assembly protein [Kofleriaceae bacterium]
MSDVVGTPQHDISVIVDGVQIRDWETYDITVDMTSPADHFTVRMPFQKDVWRLCRGDRPIRVLIDDVVALTGFIDERFVPEDDEAIEIVGRDRAGRLVDESAPGLDFSGLAMKALIEKVAAPWFTRVTLSNARNRNVIRGRGRKAKAAGEPLKLNTAKKIGTRIEPGQTRWQVIETLCAQAGVLAWSAGDGTELVVGQPNYDQEPQFRFFMPAANSTRIDESTVLGMGVRERTADRYSRVIVVGSGTGTDVNYGSRVASRYGEAKDNPSTKEGDGDAFSAPKRLIVQRSVASIAEAQELARREMARRDAHAQGLTVRCAGHGQVVAGAFTTIFAPDTIASVEDERTDTKGTYLITACTYRSGRTGEETLITLVPSGADLSPS